MTDSKHVALTKCFFCGKDDRILLCTGYTHSGRPVRDLSEANGKVIDMEPCNECKGYMQQGIILIGIVSAMSEPNWNKPNQIPNPYRSGQFAVIKEEAMRRIFEGAILDFALKHRWMFAEAQALIELGICQPAEVQS